MKAISPTPGHSATPRIPGVISGLKRISSCPQRRCSAQIGTTSCVSEDQPPSIASQCAVCSPAEIRMRPFRSRTAIDSTSGLRLMTKCSTDCRRRSSCAESSALALAATDSARLARPSRCAPRPVRQQSEEHREHHRGGHDRAEADRDVGFGAEESHWRVPAGCAANEAIASSSSTSPSSSSSSSETRVSTGSGSSIRHAGRAESALATSAPPRTSHSR